MSSRLGVVLLSVLACLALEATSRYETRREHNPSSTTLSSQNEVSTESQTSGNNSSAVLDVGARRMQLLQELTTQSNPEPFGARDKPSIRIDLNNSASRLVKMLELIVELSSSRSSANDNESQLVKEVKDNFYQCLWKSVFTWEPNTIHSFPFSNTGVLLYIALECPPKNTDSISGLIIGGIYNGRVFTLTSTEVDNQMSVHVVYPENVTSLRGLPNAPITRFQVVSSVYHNSKCGNFITATVMQWLLDAPRANSKYNCEAWRPETELWSPKRCNIYLSKLSVWNVTCACDFVLTNDPYTYEFVLYELEEEDIAATISVLVDQRSPASSDSHEAQLKKYEKTLSDISVVKQCLSKCYIEYFSTLSSLFSLDSDSILISDKIIEEIGRILNMTEPDAGKSTIGIRSNNLASFVIDLDSYDGDPPIGFGVYENYSYGMEYFRSEKEVYLLELFSMSISYSFQFSKSVISQNSRFSFLLYPPDKFFKPTAVVDGHKVERMRVLDVVLTPGHREHTDQDQLVHLFMGTTTDRRLVPGCAYWSVSLKNWTTSNCHPSADLHDGVCTCNMTASLVESKTRGQFIIFWYRIIKYVPDCSVSVAEKNDVKSDTGLFQLRLAASHYREGKVDNTRFLKVLDQVSLTSGWSFSSRRQANQDARLVGLKKNCDLKKSYERFYFQFAGDFVLVCGRYSSESLSSGFYLDLYEHRSHVFFVESKKFDSSEVFNNKSLYSLYLSPSVQSQITSHAFLLYPVGKMFYPTPRVQGINNYRMVDVILEPKNDSYHQQQYDEENQHLQGDHYVEFYQDHSPHLTTGCARWSDELSDWTTEGCYVVTNISVNICNCSLKINFNQTLSGGQYIVYSYSSAVFDDTVYEMIGKESFTDKTVILEQGLSLIRNGSLLLRGDDADMATKIMKTYCKYLSHIGEVGANNTRLKSMLSDLNQGFHHFYDDPSIENVQFLYGIPTSWSVMNAAVASHLYSNAVLNDTDIGSLTTRDSDFVLAVMGRLGAIKEGYRTYGIVFKREAANKGTYLQTKDRKAIIAMNPVFACYLDCYDLLQFYRYIFVVYPMNLSPYPYSMTSRPMFNSRQVDVYVDVQNTNWRQDIVSKKNITLTCDTTVHVYFQPTVDHNDYINIACATWDDDRNDWTEDLCKMDEIVDKNLNVSCSCKANNRKLTSIIFYEYTDVDNFFLLHSIEGPSVVFLIGATNSLGGIVLIFTTAIMFPAWREDQSNKILLQLTASSFLYLIITMIRETHLIYARLKGLDWALVLFSVSVHYTRLVHYFWSLAMSVLQYKKFASIVGASATTHLLLKISAFAWGLPFFPLGALLSWDQQAHFCTPDKLTHLMLYLVPVVVITLLNMGLLLAVIYKMTNGFGRWNDEELKKHGGGSDSDVRKRQIKQAVMMFFLFGIPAVFEMVNDIFYHSVALDYISNLLNPIQGFVLFLFFVVLHDKTSALWFSYMYGGVPTATSNTPVKKVPVNLQFFKSRVKPVARRAAVADSSENKPRSELETEMSASRLEANEGQSATSCTPHELKEADYTRAPCTLDLGEYQGQCSDNSLHTNKMVEAFEEDARRFGERLTEMIEFLQGSAHARPRVGKETRPSSDLDQEGGGALEGVSDFMTVLQRAGDMVTTVIAKCDDVSS